MNQLQKRKFRKGAVHSRKKLFTNNKEKIKRNCNLCQKEFIADTLKDSLYPEITEKVSLH